MALTYNSFYGNANFHGWTGRLEVIQYQHEPFSRVGGSGSGTQIVRARAPLSDIKTWAGFSNESQAVAFADLCATYQGLTWPCQDDNLRFFPRVRAHAVKPDNPIAGKGSELSAGIPMLYLVRVQWQLEVLL